MLWNSAPEVNFLDSWAVTIGKRYEYTMTLAKRFYGDPSETPFILDAQNDTPYQVGGTITVNKSLFSGPSEIETSYLLYNPVAQRVYSHKIFGSEYLNLIGKVVLEVKDSKGFTTTKS